LKYLINEDAENQIFQTKIEVKMDEILLDRIKEIELVRVSKTTSIELFQSRFEYSFFFFIFRVGELVL